MSCLDGIQKCSFKQQPSGLARRSAQVHVGCRPDELPTVTAISRLGSALRAGDDVPAWEKDHAHPSCVTDLARLSGLQSLILSHEPLGAFRVRAAQEAGRFFWT